MYCKKCGNKILNKKAKFCNKCGESVQHDLKEEDVPQEESMEQKKDWSFWERYKSKNIDLKTAERHIKNTKVISFIYLAFVILLVYLQPATYWLDAIIILVLLIGFYKKNTISAIGFLIYIFVSKIFQVMEGGLEFWSIAIFFIFLHYFYLGTLSVIRYNNLTGKEKSVQKKVIGGVVVGIAIIALIVYSTYFLEDFVDELFFEGTGREIENKSLYLDTSSGTTFSKNLSSVVFIACPYYNADDWVYGSGVVIDEGGFVLTNNHVVEGAEDYYCEVGFTNNLSEMPELNYYALVTFVTDEFGEAIADLATPELDMAVLEIIEAKQGELPLTFPAVKKLGKSDDLTIGDKITIIGYPAFGGDTLTATEGIIGGRVGSDLLKVSAKIDEGNSGGAMFNEQGELVGITTFGIFGSFEGLGYVVGIDSVEYWLNTLGVEF